MAKELWDDLTLDTTPAVTDRLVKQAGSATGFDSVALGDIPYVWTGVANPGSPTNGQLFFRRDLGWWIYYDTTDEVWRTCHSYTVSFGARNVSVGTTYQVGGTGETYQPWVYKTHTSMYVNSTNDGSNYWSITIQSNDMNSTGASTVATSNTSAGAANTHLDLSSSIDLSMANYGYFTFQVTPTSSPGTLHWKSTVEYQLVIT